MSEESGNKTLASTIASNDELRRIVPSLVADITDGENQALHNRFRLWLYYGHRPMNKKDEQRKPDGGGWEFTNEQLECFATEVVAALVCRLIMIHVHSRYIEALSLPSSLREMSKSIERLSSNVFGSVFQPDILDLSDPNLLSSKTSELLDSLISKISSMLVSASVPISDLDYLSTIYQGVLSTSSRKFLGEFYTSSEVVETILSSAMVAQADILGRTLDPACGSGAFLVEVLRRKLIADAANLEPNDIQGHLDKVIGIDINPLACLLSKSNILLQTANIFKESLSCLESRLKPRIYCGDALLSYMQCRSSEKPIKSLEHYLETTTCRRAQINFMGADMEVKWPIYLEEGVPDPDEILAGIISKELDIRYETKQADLANLTGISFGDVKSANPILVGIADAVCATMVFSAPFNWVVGNPPYKRVQTIHPLWKRNKYRKSFSAATGHFDLYSLFVELGLRALAEDGILSYILSNKFMTTTSGIGIRKLISNTAKVKMIIDFGDARVFDAMVLPCILVLAKSRTREPERFLWVHMIKSTTQHEIEYGFEQFLKILINPKRGRLAIRLHHTDGSTYNIAVRSTLSEQPSTDVEPWFFFDSESRNLIDALNEGATTVLGDVSETIMVGIKTTANYAFMNELTSTFLQTAGIENHVLHPVFRGTNVRAWRIEWSGKVQGKDTYLLYPHRKLDNRVRAIPPDEIPGALRYLERFKEKLESREYVIEAGRQWYEIWNPKDPDIMNRDLKIVTPDISNRNNFALDQSRAFIDGSCYIVILGVNTLENNLYILGQLNSAILEFYHKTKGGTRIYAGRYRYWSTNLSRLPIVEIGPHVLELQNKVSKIVESSLKPTDPIIARPVLTDSGLIVGKYTVDIDDSDIRYWTFVSLMSKRIIGLVKRIVGAQPADASDLERELDWEVGKLFLLEDKQIESILEWVDRDRSGGG